MHFHRRGDHPHGQRCLLEVKESVSGEEKAITFKFPMKPRLVAIRFSKAQFMTLPRAERELLIRIGLAQNDLLMMQRFWGALYYRNPKSVSAKEAHAVQQVTFLLVIVGKLFEVSTGAQNGPPSGVQL